MSRTHVKSYKTGSIARLIGCVNLVVVAIVGIFSRNTTVTFTLPDMPSSSLIGIHVLSEPGQVSSCVPKASCERICDSSSEWEKLPLFAPVDISKTVDLARDIVGNDSYSAVWNKRLDGMHDYLLSLRQSGGWNFRTWPDADRRHSECSFVCTFPDSFVDTTGIVCPIGANVCFRPDDCMNYAEPVDKSYNLTKAAVLDSRQVEKIIVLTQGYGHNFYHSVLESTIKLVDVQEALRQNPALYVHASPDTPAFPLLSVLGIDPSRILSGAVYAKHAIVPRATLCMDPTLRQLLKFRSLIMNTKCFKRAKPRTCGRPNILLIKRDPGTPRAILNYDELRSNLTQLATVKGYNFAEYISPRGPRRGCEIIEDMILFKQSQVIVAPHGAALTNAILCDPGTVVVEVQTSQIANVFTGISMKLGFRHHIQVDKTATDHYRSAVTANIPELLVFLNGVITRGE